MTSTVHEPHTSRRGAERPRGRERSVQHGWVTRGPAVTESPGPWLTLVHRRTSAGVASSGEIQRARRQGRSSAGPPRNSPRGEDGCRQLQTPGQAGAAARCLPALLPDPADAPGQQAQTSLRLSRDGPVGVARGAHSPAATRKPVPLPLAWPAPCSPSGPRAQVWGPHQALRSPRDKMKGF